MTRPDPPAGVSAIGSLTAATILHRAGRRATPVDRRRSVALALPVVIPVAMCATFAATRSRFGDRLGYIAGFAAYWATCAGAAIAILGPSDARRLYRDTRPRLGHPLALGALLLLWPPVGAVATRFLPEVRSADRSMVITIAAIGVTNGAVEELLWRGVYVTLWPDDPWRGLAWPAMGFGAWHLAPQRIHPSSMGAIPYTLSATLLGLSWGWVAWRTRSLRWVTLSHVLTDSSGVRNAVFFVRP